MSEEKRVPSRVQARDEACHDPARCDIHGHAPGDMHEPKPYTGELDFSEPNDQQTD